MITILEHIECPNDPASITAKCLLNIAKQRCLDCISICNHSTRRQSNLLSKPPLYTLLYQLIATMFVKWQVATMIYLYSDQLGNEILSKDKISYKFLIDHTVQTANSLSYWLIRTLHTLEEISLNLKQVPRTCINFIWQFLFKILGSKLVKKTSKPWTAILIF